MEVIASSLDKSSFEHIFVAIGAGGATEERLKALGARVYCLNLPTRIPSISSISALFSFFREHKPWVVHAHGAEANFHGLIAAWLARVPVRIGEEIGIPSHGLKAKFIFRHVYGISHRVVGISRSVTNWLVDSGEVPSSKATLIYNPVVLPSDHSFREIHKNVFRIGFVGRLEPVKNPVALLDAFETLIKKYPNCELWFVGDGSLRQELERKIERHGLGRHVRLWGYQSKPEDFLFQCDIYVQPSVSEGFGLALVEAMGCGLPVISTAVGGAPEIIHHGKTGWLLPVATAESIEASLIEALQLGSDKLEVMGRDARESVVGRFEPARYVAEIEDIYRLVDAENGAL